MPEARRAETDMFPNYKCYLSYVNIQTQLLLGSYYPKHLDTVAAGELLS